MVKINTQTELIKALSAELIKNYAIKTIIDHQHDFGIHKPVYINIHCPVDVVTNEQGTTFKNDSIKVWLYGNKQMHITVYDKE